MIVPINSLRPGQTFRQTLQLKALKKHIQKHGLLHPIEIDSNYVIKNGYRRWRACKELGMTTVNVYVS